MMVENPLKVHGAALAAQFDEGFHYQSRPRRWASRGIKGNSCVRLIDESAGTSSLLQPLQHWGVFQRRRAKLSSLSNVMQQKYRAMAFAGRSSEFLQQVPHARIVGFCFRVQRPEGVNDNEGWLAIRNCAFDARRAPIIRNHQEVLRE